MNLPPGSVPFATIENGRLVLKLAPLYDLDLWPTDEWLHLEGYIKVGSDGSVDTTNVTLCPMKKLK